MNNYSIVLSFFTLILLGCSQKNPQDIQSDVFKDIFSELIEDSTQDFRKIITPTPELIKLWKEGKDIPKKNIDDKRKMLVVINDSIRVPVIPTTENRKIKSSLSNALYKFSFTDFSFNDNDIKLISNNEYNKNPRKMMDEYYFGGFLDISQIFFKKGMDNAHLFVTYRLGKLNSQKSKIYIKKVNNEWSIIKTELLNIS